MPDLKETAFEDVLDKHLGQVAAPDELWTRVRYGSAARERSRPMSRRLALTMAAAMVAGGAAWVLHPRSEAELRSSNAAEVRDWVEARTELNVPLRDASSARLVGAHLTNHGSAAEIRFREGTLTVAKATETVDNHLAAVSEARPGAKTISWTMRGQAFTLACDDPDQARGAACLLCHS